MSEREMERRLVENVRRAAFIFLGVSLAAAGGHSGVGAVELEAQSLWAGVVEEVLGGRPAASFGRGDAGGAVAAVCAKCLEIAGGA